MDRIYFVMLFSILSLTSYAADKKDYEEKNQDLLTYAELIKKYGAEPKTPEEEYQENLQEYPMLRITKEIKDILIQDEVKQLDKAAMQARIEKEYAVFQESERGRCTESMRYFYIPIERTFPEYDPHPVARYIMERIKQYETTENTFGFSVIYNWRQNSDNTRSLWCRIEADQKDIMAAYGKQIVLEKQ